MTENAEFKARRYLVEGRLEVQRVDSETVLARCLGDGGRLLLRVHWDEARSRSVVSCPAYRATVCARSRACASRQEAAAMTEPLLTRSQWAAMMRAPLRDKSYQLTGLGAAVTDFLAWKRVNGAARERSTSTSATSPAVVSSTRSGRLKPGVGRHSPGAAPLPASRGIGRGRRGPAFSSGPTCGSSSSETR